VRTEEAAFDSYLPLWLEGIRSECRPLVAGLHLLRRQDGGDSRECGRVDKQIPRGDRFSAQELSALGFAERTHSNRNLLRSQRGIGWAAGKPDRLDLDLKLRAPIGVNLDHPNRVSTGSPNHALA